MPTLSFQDFLDNCYEGVIAQVQAQIILERDVKHQELFMAAVEREKKLHPGPYTKLEWMKALNAEIKEMRCERCHECGFGFCPLFDTEECLVPLKRYSAEIFDVAVVAYRMAQALGELIREKEVKINEADRLHWEENDTGAIR